MATDVVNRKMPDRKISPAKCSGYFPVWHLPVSVVRLAAITIDSIGCRNPAISKISKKVTEP
jgi:hypothetical protein